MASSWNTSSFYWSYPSRILTSKLSTCGVFTVRPLSRNSVRLQPNKVLLLGSFPPWEEENVPTAATVDSHQSRAPLEQRDNLTILGSSGNHYVGGVPVRGRDCSHMAHLWLRAFSKQMIVLSSEVFACCCCCCCFVRQMTRFCLDWVETCDFRFSSLSLAC